MLDNREFSRIYNQFFSKVYSICCRQIGNEEVAQELAQDIFQSLWERRSSLEITDGYEQYLVRAAKYKVIDWFRKRAVAQKFESEYIHATETTTESLAHFNHLQERVNNLVESLPAKPKEVYVMGRLEGFSVKQIADTLSITEKTVKNHMNRALSFLRLNLETYR